MSAGDGSTPATDTSGLANRERADAIYDYATSRHHRTTDRFFVVLLLIQWVAAVVVALAVSPYAWRGAERTIHPHVYASVFIGGAVTLLPMFLGTLRAGERSTRYVIACAQLLWSALLIHLTGGRIETHFHVFGSLAFLALYKDLPVLAIATATVVADHLIRGIYLPQSVYAVANPEWWRFLEHAGWVVFEVAVLAVGCQKAGQESRLLATQQAELEILSDRERAKSIALNVALDELRTSQNALVRSEKLAAVGQLAASVGHELRNPLAAVRNAHVFVEKRLAAQPAPDTRVLQFLGIIDREVRVCTRIIGDLLDFARERPPARIPCPVRGLVDEATSILPTSSVRVVNQVGDGLPIPSLDRDQFRQVLVNLIQNAVESIPADRDGEVRVRARHVLDNGLQISIEDDGVGMPEDVAARIFEPLYTTKAKGTGLGLAIVANIVKAHSGAIRVESEVDRGTRFVIDLPVVA